MRRTRSKSARQGRWDALAPPSLLIFFWVSDFLLPFLYAEYGRPWEGRLDATAIIRVEDARLAMIACVLFLACWLAGYGGMGWKPRAKFGLVAPRQMASPAYLVLVFCAVLALFGIVYLANPQSQFEFRSELAAGGWGRAQFFVIGALFAAYWLSTLGLLKDRGAKVPLARIAAVLFLSICMIAAFAPMEGRARMLMAVLYAMVAWHYFVRPLSTVAVWSVLALGSALALGIHYLALRGMHADVDILEMVYGLSYGRQFDGIINIAAVIRSSSLGYVEHHHGAAWLADILADIGMATGGVDSRTLFMTDVMRRPVFSAGFPMTRPGEFLLAFGWLGVALGALALGALTRLWYNWMMLARPFGAASVPVYFTFLMTAGLVTQRNYLFGSLMMAAIYVVLIVILARFVYGYRFAAARPRSVRVVGGARVHL